MKITTEQLKARCNCPEGIAEFNTRYPHGLDLTGWSAEMQIEMLRSDSFLRRYFGWAVREGLIPAWSMFRADLAGADLRYADLRLADLAGAHLTGADLRFADLAGADLTDADLASADLRRANLVGADLTGANLHLANLADAEFSAANLSGASLADANLSGANLRHVTWREQP